MKNGKKVLKEELVVWLEDGHTYGTVCGLDVVMEERV